MVSFKSRSVQDILVKVAIASFSLLVAGKTVDSFPLDWVNPDFLHHMNDWCSRCMKDGNGMNCKDTKKTLLEDFGISWKGIEFDDCADLGFAIVKPSDVATTSLPLFNFHASSITTELASKLVYHTTPTFSPDVDVHTTTENPKMVDSLGMEWQTAIPDLTPIKMLANNMTSYEQTTANHAAPTKLTALLAWLISIALFLLFSLSFYVLVIYLLKRNKGAIRM